jgi:hypothetical protein
MNIIQTFAQLQQAFVIEGQRFTCVERANAEYTVQASGYVALAGDVTFANGLHGALQVNGDFIVDFFGAVGDGSTLRNNAPSIQDAIDRASPTGGTVRLLNGVYCISDRIVINSHIKISGDKSGYQATAQNDPVGKIMPSGHLLSGSWLFLNSGTAASKGWNDETEFGIITIKYDNPNYVSGYVDRRRFGGVENIGIHGNGGGQVGTLYSLITSVDAWNIEITRTCLYTGRGHAISRKNLNFTNVNDYLIHNNWIDGLQYGTVGVYGGGGDSQIFSNHIFGFSQAGIFLISGTCQVSDNHIWSNDVGIFASSTSSNSSITTNYIYDNTGAGVVLSGVDNNIPTDSVEAICITGNNIHSNGSDDTKPVSERSGLIIVGNGDGVTICGNVFANRDSTLSQQYGIYCDVTNPTSLIMSGNGFYKNVVRECLLSSSVSVILNAENFNSANIILSKGRFNGNIDLDDNNVFGVDKISFNSWKTASLSAGILTTSSSTVSYNASSAIVVTDIAAPSANDNLLVIIRNIGVSTLTFTNNNSKLRCGGADLVLNQHQCATFCFISGSVWQLISST